MGKAWDVVAYTYAADVHCPEAMVERFGEMCSGFTPCPGHRVRNNGGTHYIANCLDVHAYDSSVYPKPIFESDVEEPMTCGTHQDWFGPIDRADFYRCEHCRALSPKGDKCMECGADETEQA